MQRNCLTAIAAHQRYENKTRNHRDGVQRLLAAAAIDTQRLNVVLDIDCRAGDTTLGVLRAAPRAEVIGVDDYLDAITLARMKFGLSLNGTSVERVLAIQSLMVTGWVDSFKADSASVRDRATFVHSSIANCPLANADLAVGFQALHGFDTMSGLPHPSVLDSIRASLKTGATLLAGTSSTFFEFEDSSSIGGMPRSQWSVLEHPFIKLVFESLRDIMLNVGYSLPPASKPPHSMNDLRMPLERTGFEVVQFGQIPIRYSIDVLLTETARSLPFMLGVLDGAPFTPLAKRQFVDEAVFDAGLRCDKYVTQGYPDPRLVTDMNVWNAILWVRAKAR